MGESCFRFCSSATASDVVSFAGYSVMRTARAILLILVPVLLAVLLFWGVRYGRTPSNPPVSVRIVVDTNAWVRFQVSGSSGGSTSLSKFELQETNNSKIAIPTTIVSIGTATSRVIIPFDSSKVIIHHDSKSGSGNFFDIQSFNQPLSAYKAYRVVVTYSHRGAFEQRVRSWIGQHVPVLNRFAPPLRKEVAKSEWFVVNPEATGTNMEH
jgi:hypothetical protein